MGPAQPAGADCELAVLYKTVRWHCDHQYRSGGGGEGVELP
jgi:hypothetical protein